MDNASVPLGNTTADEARRYLRRYEPAMEHALDALISEAIEKALTPTPSSSTGSRSVEAGRPNSASSLSHDQLLRDVSALVSRVTAAFRAPGGVITVREVHPQWNAWVDATQALLTAYSREDLPQHDHLPGDSPVAGEPR